MNRRALSAATISVLVALVLSPAAAPHGGGGAAKGYASTVTSVVPAESAVHVAVLDADDRLQVRVSGKQIVVIDGYEKEPYLRFAPDGVFRNRRSPATYLNDDRYGKVALPETADPEAAPEWEHVAAGGEAYDWHDHRIHWMSPDYPRAIEDARDTPHHIFDWTVPGTIDARPLTINGTLDYTPPPGQTFPKILILPLVLLAVAGLALVTLRRRRLRGP